MNYDAWRPFISKFVAPLIGLAATWLNSKYGILFDDAEQNQIVVHLVDLVIFAISTGVSSVGINKFVNPGNAASSHLAAAEHQEVKDIKAAEAETK